MPIRTTQIGNEIWVGQPPFFTRTSQIGNEVWLITIPVPGPSGPTGPPPPPISVSGDSPCNCDPPTYEQLNTVP